jgi:cell wall-associated NlpC family hydrolase
MIGQPRPRGRWRWSLAAWTVGIGLAWLLLGHQYASQPAVHLDLTAGLPGAATMHQQPAAPRQPASTPQRQNSPPSSPRSSTRTSPPTAHSPASSTRTSTGGSHAAARAVTFALAQRGKPYQWGAEGPDTYDCSGLVWLAWQHAGLDWPRMNAVAQWQWLHGRQVPASQLRAGDLLFYATNPQDPATIHHVAMATDHARMIEAPAPGIPVRTVTVRHTELFAVIRP